MEQQLRELGIVDQRDYSARSREFERRCAEPLRQHTQAAYEASRAVSILSAAASALRQLRGRTTIAGREWERNREESVWNRSVYER